MKEQLYNILEKLIVKNNIQVNRDELKLQLSSHPSYPSLHALTGVLNHFSIPNVALRLAVNQEILNQLPNSFIANINNNEGEDLVLIEKKKDKIKVIKDNNDSIIISKATFLKQWKGIIVAIEKDETVNETVQNPITKYAKWAMLSIVVVLTGYLMFISGSVFSNLHFILSVVGLVISTFIVKHELGLQSSTANSFCNLSQKTSCDAVLNSNGATIFGVFKLSDVSIITFSCCCLFWALSYISNTVNTSLMLIVSLLAFPFVIYSVYYQFNVVKKWCPLCLAIASVLLIQIGLVFATNNNLQLLTLNFQSVMFFSIALITSIGFWSVLKPLIKKKETLEKVEVEHYKFKRNFSVFKVLHDESDMLKTFSPIPGEISLGNPKAETKLVIVTSPLCYYCKEAHSDIDYLLNRIGESINVIIRFNVTTYKRDNQLFNITSRLLDLYNSCSNKEVTKALNEVYKNGVNLQDWLSSQNIISNNSYNAILEQQSEWCNTNAINFTPALYVNGKLFPKEYDRKDLIYFIDDLKEQQQSFVVNEAIAS